MAGESCLFSEYNDLFSFDTCKVSAAGVKVTKEGEDQVLKSRTFSFALQLELITELLGTPTLEDMRFACEGARSHMLRRAPKPPSLTALYTLSSQATHEAVHLLCQMLVFDPVSFITLSYRYDIVCRLYRIVIYMIEMSSIEYIEYKACSYRCTTLLGNSTKHDWKLRVHFANICTR